MHSLPEICGLILSNRTGNIMLISMLCSESIIIINYIVIIVQCSKIIAPRLVDIPIGTGVEKELR